MKKTIASGQALAVIVLAVALVRVLIARMFGALTGLRLFRQNYDADRLPPLTSQEREDLPSFSGCFACGRCDLGEGERMAQSRGAYPGMMSLVLASSRSMPDFDAAARGFAFVPVEVLKAKRKACPANVPFDEIASFVQRKASEMAGTEGKLA